MLMLSLAASDEYCANSFDRSFLQNYYDPARPKMLQLSPPNAF
jgi:hypothetical protein